MPLDHQQRTRSYDAGHDKAHNMAAVCLQFFVYNSAAKVDGGRESMVFLGRSLAALQTTTFWFFFDILC